VINAETDEVLLDSLVKPIWPVVDYRTFVNGIAAEHLANVEFTLRHAQAFMMALCSSETVIVGQALHNDLAALRMEHYCVADSACLFKAQDSPTATVGLRDLAASVLKKAMPEKHDSVNDARMALACVKHYMEKDGNVEAVQRSYSSKPDYVCQLFVHRIPKNVCDESHLARMFLEHTFVKPVEVEEIDFSSGASGKTRIVFKTARHANLSFDTLEGKAEPDASGRMQKKVYLRNGSYVRVRKMAFDKNSDGSSSTPRRSSTG
jgi:RNA exonuclease 1